jgi:hypothetical protein
MQPRLNSSKSSALYYNMSAFKVIGTDYDQTEMILRFHKGRFTSFKSNFSICLSHCIHWVQSTQSEQAQWGIASHVLEIWAKEMGMAWSITGEVNIIKLGWTWLSVCSISLDLIQFVWHQSGLVSLCFISLNLFHYVYHQLGLVSVCVSSSWTWFSLCIISMDLIQFVYHQLGLVAECVSSTWTWFSLCIIKLDLIQFVYHQHGLVSVCVSSNWT